MLKVASEGPESPTPRLRLMPVDREWLTEAVQECSTRGDELNRELERFGFAVTADLDSWEHLARIIQVDPAEMTVAELYREALAWVDRVRIEERIRHQIGGVAQSLSNLPAAEPEIAEQERENTGWGFLGNRDWENWGVGRDIRGVWHLYHFHRRDGAWKRHRHRILGIRGGLQDGLAQAFLSECGQVTEGLARDVWQGYSRGMSSESTTNLVKSAISNLRKAIREAIRKEGHHPRGSPISRVAITIRITRSARLIFHFKNHDSPTRRASVSYASSSRTAITCSG
ncbi:MAG: hypothetical protein KDA60_14525 [Planctomycetales bacterium]|nr:hypothetical protein [Planctomycetales bacterium]